MLQNCFHKTIVAEAARFCHKNEILFRAEAGGDAGKEFGERSDFGDAEGAPEGPYSVAAHDEDGMGALGQDVFACLMGETRGHLFGIRMEACG